MINDDSHHQTRLDEAVELVHKISPTTNESKRNSSNVKKILADIRTVILATGSGVLFGFFINKGMVFIAPTIRQQMLFNRFAMLKMFMAAVGTSMLSVSLLEICAKALYAKILNGYIDFSSRRNILHYVFGGSMIGLGMITCGSCPGTVLVQVGSGITNSLFTCLGGLLGTYFYYIVVHHRIQAKNNQLHHFFFDVYRIYCI